MNVQISTIYSCFLDEGQFKYMLIKRQKMFLLFQKNILFLLKFFYFLDKNFLGM